MATGRSSLHDVIISGGGPVGLGLAIELGQRGLRVALIERNLEPPHIPKGQNLTQRTMEHMQVWGVEDAIRAAKTIPKGYGLGGLTAYGSLQSGYHYNWFNRGTVDAYYNASNERLPQYETERVLRARVANLNSVDAYFGWTTTAIDFEESGVSLVASNGSGPREFRAQYLVGCDGSNSFVRSQAGITETAEDHDRLMALVVFESQEFFRLISQFKDKQFYNVLRPEHDGYWMFFGMVEWGKSFFFHAPVPRDIDRESFDFKDYIRGAVGGEIDLEPTYVGFWDLRIALADSYRKGRVFIAGDAAHSHPPYGGYGVNTGFEDARNLGWKLAAVIQGWGGLKLLESYDAERRPVFASTASDFIERFIREDQAFVRLYDPEKDKTAFETAWSARAAGGQAKGIGDFAPHYRGSPVISGARPGLPSAVGQHSFSAEPGHHLPPVATTDGVSVTDQFGPRFSVVTQPGVHYREGESEHPNDLDVELIEAEQVKSFSPFTLVRPDGFVAGTADDPSELPGLVRIATGL